MLKVVVIVALLAARTAHANPGDRWDAVMLVEQSAAGIGGGLVGATLLGLAGAAIGAAGAKGNDWGPPLVGLAVGGSIGGLAGITLGVQITGDARGGNGAWGATIGGTIGGGLLAAVTAPRYIDRVPKYVGFGLLAVTLIAPPVIAYQLTTDERNTGGEQRVMVPLIGSTF